MARTKLVLLGKRRPDLLDAGFVSVEAQSNLQAQDEMKEIGLIANRLSHEDQNRYSMFFLFLCLHKE